MMDPRIADALSNPRSQLQGRLLNHAKVRIEAADKRWSQRHPRWRESEKTYRSFRYADRQDIETRNSALTEGVEKIVVPFSYAVLQSMLAFFVTVFTDRKPIIPVEGVGPDDVRAAYAMELLLQDQMDRMEPSGILVMIQWFFDALMYGVGVVKNGWVVREFPDLVRSFQTFTNPLTGAVQVVDSIESTDVVDYEGNETINILPFDFFPDPRHPYAYFQRGEFVDHRMWRSFTELRQKEAQGVYIGLEFVQKREQRQGAGSSESTMGQPSDLSMTLGMDDEDNPHLDEHGHPFVELHEMQTYLDPADLGVPGAQRTATPRLWTLSIANMSRVIRAEHANLPGRRFPYEIIEPNYNLHSPANVGMIEVFRGLQSHLSWLINCYDAETEILTERGWVEFPQLTLSDRVATVDPETGAYWYETPVRYYRMPYEGDLIRIDSQRVDLLVTPNHDIWAAKRINHPGEAYAPYAKTPAEDLDGEYAFRVGGLCEEGGTDGGEFVLPAEGRYPERRVPALLWASFLGWFVSDGSASHGIGGTYAVRISQKKEPQSEAIEALMAQLPWTVHRREKPDGTHIWEICDGPLFRWLASHAGCRQFEKRLPDSVFAWCPSLREQVLRCAIAGDGQETPGYECKAYRSTSRQLADDIQRLALSIGWMAYRGDSEQTLPSGLTYYTVNLNPMLREHHIATSRNLRKEPYSGIVYCVENSTHLVVVRRNGRTVVCSQSRMQNVRKTLNNELVIDPSMLFEEDYLRPNPAGIWRLNKHAQGAGFDLRQIVQPLPVMDVTASHLTDARVVTDLIEQVTGANRLIMGLPNPGRRAATEVQGQLSLASGRMKLLAGIGSAQGLERWAGQMARNTQAFMSEPITLQLRPEYQRLLGAEMVQVTPELIQGQFRFPFLESGIPTDRAFEANVWREVLSLGANSGMGQQLLAGIRFDEVFKRLLRVMGVKNLGDFFTLAPLGGVQLMDDEAVQQGVTAGNLVPSDGFAMPPGGTVPNTGGNGLDRTGAVV